MINPQQQQFLKSYIYYSNDLGTIPDALMRSMNVVCLVDPSEMSRFPGCYSLSMLLPNTQSILDLLNIDNDDPHKPAYLNKFLADYQIWLSMSDKEDSMVVLLASVYKTTHPVLLYCDYDVDSQFHILESLGAFLKNIFGIVIGRYEDIYTNDPSKSPAFIPAPQYQYAILDLLFINGYISKEEYAVKLPPGSIPSPRAIPLILSDFNYTFVNLNESLRAVCNIIETIKHEALSGKQCPVVQISKALENERQQKIAKIVNDSKSRFGNKTIAELNNIQQQYMVNQQNQIPNIQRPKI